MQNHLLAFGFTITANGLSGNLNILNFVCIILAHILPTEMVSYLLLKLSLVLHNTSSSSVHIFSIKYA